MEVEEVEVEVAKVEVVEVVEVVEEVVGEGEHDFPFPLHTPHLSSTCPEPTLPSHPIITL